MMDMVASGLIVLREGFEAVLLTTMMLLLKDNGRISSWHVWAGVGLGILGSAAVAWIIVSMGFDLEEYEWAFSLATAVVLTYVVTANASISRHAREHLSQIESSSGWLITVAIALVFLREGIEVVLMLYGMMLQNPLGTSLGAGIAALLLILGSLSFRREMLSKIAVGKIMLISNILLAAMAVFFYYDAYASYFTDAH